MDIISAHRDGLIEQLDVEVAALAGRARDHAQRAMVLHHLFDHSRGNHLWALGEARRTLRIAAGLKVLRGRLDRWVWLGTSRDEARVALERFAEVIGEVGRERTRIAYRAYRLSGSPALRGEAETSLEGELLALLDQCHLARRSGEALAPEASIRLAEWRPPVSGATEVVMAKAWAEIDATGIGRAAKRLLGEPALAKHGAKDRRRSANLIERDLLADPNLPPSFKANPAQHFYALQHQLKERRRQQWREACDREPDAFELAA